MEPCFDLYREIVRLRDLGEPAAHMSTWTRRDGPRLPEIARDRTCGERAADVRRGVMKGGPT